MIGVVNDVFCTLPMTCLRALGSGRRVGAPPYKIFNVKVRDVK